MADTDYDQVLKAFQDQRKRRTDRRTPLHQWIFNTPIGQMLPTISGGSARPDQPHWALSPQETLLGPEGSTSVNYLRSGVAGAAGLPGDMADMWAAGMAVPPQQILPNTEAVAEALNADLESPSGIAGLFGFPDVFDALGIVAKATPLTLGVIRKGKKVLPGATDVGNSVEIAGKRYYPHKVDERSGYKVVMMDRDLVEEMTAGGEFVGPGPDYQNQIGDRIKNFEKFWSENDEIQVGNAFVDDKGYMSFGDGRHRTRVMLDSGMEQVPVSMGPEARENLAKYLRARNAPSQGISLRPSGEQLSLEDRISRYLTDEERALMTPNDRGVMEGLLKVSASPQEVASMAAAGGAKLGWYEESTKALRHVFGDDSNQFAALLAATSPQTSVESNLRNALNIWKNWVNAGRPKGQREILEIMAQSVERTPIEKMSADRLTKMIERAESAYGNVVPVEVARGGKAEKMAFLKTLPDQELAALSVLPAWQNNTIRALTHEGGPQALSGPKVTSFWKNLIGQMDEVTQDTWMARALGMSQSRDFSGRGLVGIVDDLGKLGVKKPGYFAGNILVREAADIMTQATGRQWQPAEIQETVWSWAKALYEAGAGDNAATRVPELLKQGAVTDDIIRDVPDFATLFRDNPEFHGILEEAGYGQQLNNLPESGFGGRGAIGLDPESSGYLESAARRLGRTGEKRGTGKRAGTSEDLRQLVLSKFPGARHTEGGASGTFRRRTVTPRSGVLAGQQAGQYSLPKPVQASFNRLNVPTPAVYETTDPQVFFDAITEAKAANRYGGSVERKSLEEYAEARMFLTPDGSAGFAIKPDGDIVSVFNRGSDPKLKGLTPYFLSLARELGGTKLDAFDIKGILPNMYRLAGFEEVERLPWNPAMKAADWDEAVLGTPDVVFMEAQ